MARRVENWVQEQVDLTVHGRVRRRSESKMETGGPDPGGGASPKKSKKKGAATEQRKMPLRRVKGSEKSDGQELRSPPTKRKREEPPKVATQQDNESHADGAECATSRDDVRKNPAETTAADKENETEQNRVATEKEIKYILSDRSAKHNMAVLSCLHGRFKNCKIETQVNRDVIGNIEIVYEPTSGSGGFRPGYSEKYAVEEKSNVIPEDYEKKWQDYESMEDQERVRRLKPFLKVIETEISYTSFDIYKGNWGCDAMEACIEDIRTNGYVAYSKTDGPKAGKVIGQGDAPQKEKAAREKDGALESAMKLGDALFDGVFNNMHGSCGRKMMIRFLKAAAYVCQGEDFKDYIGIQEVTSNPIHGFPVVNKLLKQKTGEEFSVDSSDDDDISSDDPLESESSSGVNSPRITPKKRVKRKAKCEVFPDAVVVKKGKSPRYLMVAKVKSEPMKEDWRAQVICDMMGAGMHQEGVIGVLLCVNEAQFLRMCVKKAERKVEFHGGSRLSFDFQAKEQFVSFFLKLVASMDYALSK